MANIPLQSITFPGLSDKYTTPTVDATLTQTGAAADAKKTGDEIGAIKNDLSEKADKSEALSAYIVETETGAIASFTDGADNVPVKDLTVNIEPVQIGSGDPSPSNVRPISGWTGANVTACGKNLIDYSDNVRNQMSYANGVLSNSTTDDRTSAYINIALLKNNTQVSRLVQSYVAPVGVFSKTFTVENDFDHIRIWHSGSRADFICTIPLSLPNGTYTISIDFLGVNPSVAGEFAYKDIQVEVGSTATAYEPYQGETYEVDWTTEAGTVYGGTLDVTTGVLTVDRGYIASYNGETLPSTWISDRDVYASGTTPTTGAQVVYTLASPQTYQLTAHEVSTILGQNNIFADCGDTTVQYRADTKLYIDKVLSQA